MALSPQSNEAFLREVDDELRRDQAIALWRRWGIAIVVAVVLGLAAFAGWLFWQSHREAKAGEQGITFNKALDELGNNRAAAAAPMLDQLAKDGTPGYAALSKFTLADIALQKDDLKGAAAKFAEVAGDGSAAQPLRDLALVRQTLAEYDSLQPQVVIDRMRPLAIKGKPFFGSAGEMTAVAYLRMGRKDLAGRLFGDLAKDEGVPSSTRQRAVQMAGVLGIDAVDTTEEKKPE
ncbi:tetratricopeptide repeat protein [Sphingomonas sp.]|uniref:tetratricopeptide repeat protein n=1 Tax=Sphingomonas sp. TaxID=28214 RepID=UPI002C82BDF9|nr:tetratricopeptide repeat protein [Sphingomonas sp.]HWK36493.1 tetratricopeptide repeat protein [Sphingomonas sp.]